MPQKFMKEILIEYKDNNNDLNSHHHSNHEIVYIVEGTAMFNINGNKYIANKNSLIFISALEKHNVTLKSNNYKRYYILINHNIFDSFLPSIDLLSILTNRPKDFSHLINISYKDNEYINNIFKSLLLEYKNEYSYSNLAVETYIKQLFILLFRKYNDAFPQNKLNKTKINVRNIQIYIDKNYTSNITLCTLSEKFFLSKYYISHIFKEITGYSFKEYLILKRLQKSKFLLITTNESIINICEKSGFNNVNNFIRTFKNYMSCTPLEFRKKHVGN